jgi:Ca2+/Na+ antiporter
MLLGALWLVVAAVAATAGSAALGRGVAELAARRRMPVAPVRSGIIGLGAATATMLVAVGRGQTSVAGGIFPGAALFVLAAAFGAAFLLVRRPAEVREPMGFVATAAALVLIALLAADGEFTRGEGVLLTLLFLPYASWAAMEPGRDPAPAADYREAPVGAAHPGWSWALAPRTDPPRPDQVPEPEPGRGEAGEPENTSGTARGLLRSATGIALLAGGAFALVEGSLRVAVRAPLAPGFAGAAIAGSIAALPFALLVVFPRARQDTDPPGAALGTVTGLVVLAPGLAAVVRPFELDGPAAIALLGAAGLYALAGTWMLFRGRGGRVLGALVLAAYAACLAYAGSL